MTRNFEHGLSRQLMLWRYINWKAMLFNWTINWNLTVSILMVYNYIYKSLNNNNNNFIFRR